MDSWPPPAPATVYPGDCRATLAALPPGVFQTCVTSIPYWGLRAYGTAPQVWGGDGACDHAWQAQGKRISHPQSDSPGGFHNSQSRGQQANTAGKAFESDMGATCARCGAWRGEYGGEPTVSAYLAHTVEVFRAVRRVLRPDGTLFLNIGDAYSSGGAKQAGRNDNGRTAEGRSHGWAEYDIPRQKVPRAKSTRYRLRPDLTDQEIAHVLQELAAACQVRKPRPPEVAPRIYETVAAPTGSE